MIFYVFYSQFSLHDSLENAVSEHLEWLDLLISQLHYALPTTMQKKLPWNWKCSALFNLSDHPTFFSNRHCPKNKSKNDHIPQIPSHNNLTPPQLLPEMGHWSPIQKVFKTFINKISQFQHNPKQFSTCNTNSYNI